MKYYKIDMSVTKRDDFWDRLSMKLCLLCSGMANQLG